MAVGVCGCGIDEIISNKDNGFLLNPQNSDDVADCIGFCYDNRDICDLIAINGYNTVVNNYTWKYSAKNLSMAYEKIIGNN